MSKKVITITGYARYLHCQRPGQYGYGGEIIIKDKDEAKRVYEAINEVYAGLPSPKNDIPFTTNEDGTYTVRVKDPNFDYKDKLTGQPARTDKKIAVVDARLQPTGTMVGNGSKVCVSVDLYVYQKPKNGVKLQLQAVQILELVDYGNAGVSQFTAQEDAWTDTSDQAQQAAADEQALDTFNSKAQELAGGTDEPAF